jgi:hypothetical protein
MKVLNEFHSRGKFEKSFNATFVSLIPKKAGAMEIKDFGVITFSPHELPKNARCPHELLKNARCLHELPTRPK